MRLRKAITVPVVVLTATLVTPFVSSAPSVAASSITPYCQSVLHTLQTSETQAMWCQIQWGPATMNGEGYNGPADGVPGPNTWKGLQLFLSRYFGYTGPIDGIPGTNTYKAMQRMAAKGGYTGAIDGVLGPNSWRGFGMYLYSLINP